MSCTERLARLLIKTLWHVVVAFFACLWKVMLSSTGKEHPYAIRLVVDAAECALFSIVERRSKTGKEEEKGERTRIVSR